MNIILLLYLFVIVGNQQCFSYECYSETLQVMESIENGEEISAFVNRTFAIALPTNASFNCTWVVRVPKGKTLSFQLTNLSLHWCKINCRKCMRVSIFDGDGNQIRTNQCTSSAPSHKFKTGTNSASLVFTVMKQRSRSDFFIHYHEHWQPFGFSAKVFINDAIDEDEEEEDFIPCHETTVISGPIGTFGTIQSYLRTTNGLYRSNENCKWLIRSTNPGASVRFILRSLDVEDSCECNLACWDICKSDYLAIFNGNESVTTNPSSDIALFHCGDTVAQCKARALSSEALVVFKSNDFIEFSGFILDFEILSAEIFPHTTIVTVLNSTESKTGSIGSYQRSSTGKYRANDVMRWAISVSSEEVFSFKFTKFQLDDICHQCDCNMARCPDYPNTDDYDFLAFGKDFCFCGRNVSLNRTFDFINFENSTYTIAFRTNFFLEFDGFQLDYEFIPKNDAMNCQGVVKVQARKSGTIENYVRKNGKFRRNENCSWVLSASPGERLKLQIDHFDIDPCDFDSSCNCSYLTVFDGPPQDHLILFEKQCGSPSTMSDRYFSFESTRAVVTIVFVTDSFEFYDPTGNGFVIRYEVIPSPTFYLIIAATIIVAVVIGICISYVVGSMWAKSKRKKMQERKAEIADNVIGDMYIIPMPSLQNLLQEMGYNEFIDFMEHLAIPPEQIEIDPEILGEGTFGLVRKGHLLGEEWQSQSVAVKSLKSNNTKDLIRFLREGLILHKLNHENVVPIIGVTLIDTEPLLVFPLMKQGSLKNYLQNNRQVGSVQRLEFCRQICNAMHFLETKQCLHRDLASRNVLLDDNLIVKLSDFGMAHKLENSSYYRLDISLSLPLRWYPPEALQHPFTFTLKSDVWSFGVTCWEIFALPRIKEPYEGVPYDTVIAMVCNGLKLERPRRCPNLLFKSVIDKCWQFDPQDRPTFHDLLLLFPENITKCDG